MSTVTTIEELKTIVNDENRTAEERQQAAEHILKLTREPKENILQRPTIEDLFNEDHPWNRKYNALVRTVKDVRLPMVERIAAVRELTAFIGPRHHLSQFSDDQLVERLTEHPHVDRLKELKAAIKNESLTIRERFAAIDLHRRLLDEYPKREIPFEAFVMHQDGYDDAPGRKLASEVGNIVAKAFGRSWSYVAKVVRANRGIDLGCTAAELAEWLRQHPEVLSHF